IHVEALNHALRGIPRETIRYHTCYGINMGPRIHDMEVKDIIDIVLKVNAGAFSFEAANPRHEHEWTVWADAKIPDGAVLIPGVISHSTILVEHPELIAQRIARYADIVGRENVIAGSDCGFATFAGSDEVHESIVWAKLDALAKGARLASQRLWAKRGAKTKAAAATARKSKRPSARPSKKARRASKRWTSRVRCRRRMDHRRRGRMNWPRIPAERPCHRRPVMRPALAARWALRGRDEIPTFIHSGTRRAGMRLVGLACASPELRRTGRGDHPCHQRLPRSPHAAARRHHDRRSGRPRPEDPGLGRRSRAHGNAGQRAARANPQHGVRRGR